MPPSNTAPGYVYLVRVGGVYKIGCSRNPDKRKNHVEPYNKNAELIHQIETFNMRESESFYHALFRHRHYGGYSKEWFCLTPEDVAVFCSIRRLNVASFDAVVVGDKFEDGAAVWMMAGKRWPCAGNCLEPCRHASECATWIERGNWYFKIPARFLRGRLSDFTAHCPACVAFFKLDRIGSASSSAIEAI